MTIFSSLFGLEQQRITYVYQVFGLFLCRAIFVCEEITMAPRILGHLLIHTLLLYSIHWIAAQMYGTKGWGK